VTVGDQVRERLRASEKARRHHFERLVN